MAEKADRTVDLPCKGVGNIGWETLLEYGQHVNDWLSGCVWRYLFRRQLIADKQLRFKSFIIGEDNIFLLDLFTMCPGANILVTDLNIYRYRQRGSSVTYNYSFEYAIKKYNCRKSIIAYSDEVRKQSGLYSCQIDEYINNEKVRLLQIIFCGRLSLSVFKMLFEQARAEHIFPFGSSATVYQRVASFFSRHVYLTYFMSKLHRKVYCPLKRLRSRQDRVRAKINYYK